MSNENATPAPALTDEQIDREMYIFRDLAASTDGTSAGIVRPRFDSWLAAVIARAKREERERIADALIDLGEKSTGGTGDTARAYRYGIADAVRIATEATDDETH